MYKKYFHKNMSYRFNKRLTICCGDTNCVVRYLTVGEDRLISSEPDEIVIVICTSGR